MKTASHRGADLVKSLYERDRWGVLFNSGALWIGAHYSRYDRRWCINLLPCLTLWIRLKNGRPPKCVKERSPVTRDMVERANQRVMEAGAVAKFRREQQTREAARAWREECDRVARRGY